MEQPTEYGIKKFASCKKCSYTAPLASFSRQAGLFTANPILICPVSELTFPADKNSLFDSSKSLPDAMVIISGGQTGVDRGALDAAIEWDIPHRGWCTKGRKAEDGRIPARYNMQEIDGWQYWKRTEKNILSSDGTLVFPGKQKSKGTALTIRLAHRHGKPLAVINPYDPSAVETVRSWIANFNIREIKIAGPRESGAPGISLLTRNLLGDIFSTRQGQKQNFQEAL